MDAKSNVNGKKDLIFYEVDIQNDFMNKDNGRLYVPGAEDIKPTIADVVNLALEKGIRRVRSRDRHFADDPELIENGGPFPRHCMDWRYEQKNSDGSYGFDYIPELKVRLGNSQIHPHKVGEIHERQLNIPAEEISYHARLDAILRNDIEIEKQHYDVFTNPSAGFLFSHLKERGLKSAVVYGVATDYCVKAAVIGMQQRGIQCYVLEDAIRGVAPETTNAAIAEMKETGAKFITTKDLYKMLGGA